jgi:hypothetical protein
MKRWSLAALAVALTLCNGCASNALDACEGAECADASAAEAVAAHTTVIPVVPVFGSPPRITIYGEVSGIGSGARVLYLPLALTVGSTVRAARVRIADSGDAHLQAGIASQDDVSQNLKYIALSSTSSGTGALETLTVTAPLTVTPSTTYYLAVFHTSALVSSLSRVYRAEVDSN